MRKSMGILTVAAIMLFAQTATYAAEQTTKEREGAGKISGKETQKQSGQEVQKQSGQETQKQSGQEMQGQSGQTGQAGSVNFSEEMQRQNTQIWKSGQQAQSQCQRPGKSQQAASQQPGTQPMPAGQQAASQQPATQPSQAGQQATSQQAAAQDQGKQTQDQSAAGPGNAQTVKGQFVRMESDFYVIKDQGGKEVCIPSSYGTFIDQTFSPGDTIVARLGQDGNALVIGRPSDRQTASSSIQGQEMSQGTGDQRGDRSFSGSQQGSQGQGMTGSSGDQPRRDKDLAGSQQGSQGQDLGVGTSEQSTKNRDKGKLQAASVVTGELLRIQGEFYTVKETSGNEVRLHVNKETKMDIPVNVGDKIEAERTASDHALSIKKAQEAGMGTGEGSRTR